MRVLLWRGWAPTFNEGVTFSRVHEQGLGGTEMQMLWHAQHLVADGHQVQIVGATLWDTSERGVDFVGCSDRRDQQAAIASGRITRPDVILLEGSFHAAGFFRDAFPRARIVHIGQNIDVHADKAAFACSRYIDVYAFVGLGHLADYSSRFPWLRHKFMLVRNALPWEEFHGQVHGVTECNKVVWVGGWSKKGLRTWFEVMESVLNRYSDLQWVLCGPLYASSQKSVPEHLSTGLRLPEDRISYRNLPLMELLKEIASARAVLVSLGNECGPGSVLDAHAMARPVLSGNDMIYKFSNPEGTGLRVSSAPEGESALRFVLENPAAGKALGEAGKTFVMAEYHERRQRDDLNHLLGYLQLGESVAASSHPGTARWQERLQDLIDKVSRRWRTLRSP